MPRKKAMPAGRMKGRKKNKKKPRRLMNTTTGPGKNKSTKAKGSYSYKKR